jgi:hypothetical protein
VMQPRGQSDENAPERKAWRTKAQFYDLDRNVFVSVETA